MEEKGNAYEISKGRPEGREKLVGLYVDRKLTLK
jgi:hypothetical protein